MLLAAKIKPEEKQLNMDIVLSLKITDVMAVCPWDRKLLSIYLFRPEWGRCVKRGCVKVINADKAALSLPSAASAFSWVWMLEKNLSFMQHEKFILCYSLSVYYSGVYSERD